LDDDNPPAFSAGACSSFSLKPEINEILGSANRDFSADLVPGTQPVRVRHSYAARGQSKLVG
jgi:hypothetical protein